MSDFEFESAGSLHYFFQDPYHFYIENNMDEVVFRYEYNPEFHYTIHTWKNYCTPDELIEIYVCVAKFSYHHKNRIFGTLSDLIDVEGSFEPFNEWFMREYMPVAIKNGFAFSAVVRPKDFFAGLALEDMEEIAIYQYKDFDSKEEALSWLEISLKDYTFSKTK